MIVALDPIEAPRLTRVARTFQSALGLRGAILVGGTRIAVVGEHHAMADEHLVLDRDAFADEGV